MMLLKNNMRWMVRCLVGRIRLIFYRVKHVDRTCYFAAGSKISKDLRMGMHGFINSGALIYPRVYIGDYVMFAKNVSVIGGDHNFRTVGVPMIFAGRDEVGDTYIGDDVWVGQNSIIMRGVRVGDASIVAAGSVVTKDIPGGQIWGGIPARFLSYRFPADDDFIMHVEKIKNGYRGAREFTGKVV